MDERDHEIGAEQNGDGEAEDRFEHQSTSKPFEKPRINGKKAEGADAHGKKDQVQHDELQRSVGAWIMQRFCIKSRCGRRVEEIRK